MSCQTAVLCNPHSTSAFTRSHIAIDGLTCEPCRSPHGLAKLAGKALSNSRVRDKERARVDLLVMKGDLDTDTWTLVEEGWQYIVYGRSS